MFSVTSKGYVFDWDCILFLFVFGIGLIAIGIVLEFLKNKFKRFNKLIGLLSSICYLTVFAFIPMTFVADYQLSKIPWEISNVKTEYLLSARDNNVINGNVKIHRTRIDEKLYYQYYAIRKGGEYYSGQIRSDLTSVFYDDTPRIETYSLKRKWLLWFQDDIRYKMYVPQNSLSEDFEFDLE